MDTYNEIIQNVAKALEAALRLPHAGDVTLWAVPTTATHDGYFVIGIDQPPMELRPCVVRPSDNHASTFHSWRSTPYSSFATILWQACRHQAILPITRKKAPPQPVVRSPAPMPY